ncbi:hypothetical protein JCM14244_16510 [Venenivibrio stagnispumantis]|uniref:hypothetical protein n=1 Tax=Venenivibrio stagnispumantis TaxID=407998 RepID=UPI002235AA32|nr:hypothetical protein [Venenivibrio stagnispumantis]MCW4573995.1 hypothetical protein [Venenivibrio stagnispumantis]
MKVAEKDKIIQKITTISINYLKELEKKGIIKITIENNTLKVEKVNESGNLCKI